MDSHFANLPSITGLYFPGHNVHWLFFGPDCGPNLFLLCNSQWLPYTTHSASSVQRYLCMLNLLRPKVVALLASHACLTCFSQIDSWHEEASKGAHKVKMPFMPEVNPAFYIVANTDRLQLNVVLFASIFCYCNFNQ